jgi:creatinine amidohydrolase
VIAVSDLMGILRDVFALEAGRGISPAEGGVHAGEWETSLMLAIRPDLVHMHLAAPGYVGDMGAGLAVFGDTVEKLTPTGVFGDPRRATAANGAAYLAAIVDTVVRMVEA